MPDEGECPVPSAQCPVPRRGAGAPGRGPVDRPARFSSSKHVIILTLSGHYSWVVVFYRRLALYIIIINQANSYVLPDVQPCIWQRWCSVISGTNPYLTLHLTVRPCAFNQLNVFTRFSHFFFKSMSCIIKLSRQCIIQENVFIDIIRITEILMKQELFMFVSWINFTHKCQSKNNILYF